MNQEKRKEKKEIPFSHFFPQIFLVLVVIHFILYYYCQMMMTFFFSWCRDIFNYDCCNLLLYTINCRKELEQRNFLCFFPKFFLQFHICLDEIIIRWLRHCHNDRRTNNCRRRKQLSTKWNETNAGKMSRWYFIKWKTYGPMNWPVSHTRIVITL